MKVMVLARKSTYTILVAAELAGFCGRPFLFERSNDRLQYSDMSIWQTFFLGDEQVNQSLKKNNWECLLPTIKFNLSSKSQNFVKLVCATMNLTDSQYLTKLSDETGSVINVFYILLILYNKMCQPLEVLCNSVHQIFQIANARCYEIMHEWKSQSSRQTYTFSNRLQNVHW